VNTAIPQSMRDEPRWVLWRLVSRGGKPTKVPFTTAGKHASSTDPATWTDYETARQAFTQGGDLYSGIGFTLGDGWAGVDLDNCLDPVSDELTDWASDTVFTFDSYAEISPSGKGVKIFFKGSLPGDGKGRKHDFDDGGRIEVYGKGRYFTVTGEKLDEAPTEVRDGSVGVDTLWRRWFEPAAPPREDTPRLEDCIAALAALPDSIEGQRGHDAMFRAACEIRRWGLEDAEAWKAIHWFNKHKCEPPWSIAELKHKWKSACQEQPLGGDLSVLDSLDPEVKHTPRSFDLGLLPHNDFMGLHFDQSFLIDDVLVAGEHFIVGGPHKSFKTSILVDLGVSLAGGGKFLGCFPVEKPHPVIIVSGESGGATLQRTARRIVEEREVDASRLFWGLRIPNLSAREHLDALARDIDRVGAKLAVIDPAYLAVLVGASADSAKNVFAMGEVLRGFGDVGVKTGCVMALAHHLTKGGGRGYVEPELSMLSQSGFAEWARQWLLVSHAQARMAGRSRLHMNVGGSAGHGGRYFVDIDEGPPGLAVRGDRWWKVQVTSKDADEPLDVADTPLGSKVVKWARENPGPFSEWRLKEAIGRSAADLKVVVEGLLASGAIVTVGANRKGGSLYSLAEAVDDLLG
jgi:hypothetical protein